MLLVFLLKSVSAITYDAPKNFRHWDNEIYAQEFSIPIVYNKTEPGKTTVNTQVSIGHYGSSSPDKVFTTNVKEHWEGKSIANKVANFTVKFSSPVTYERVLYFDRRDTNKGWPYEFKLFSKQTDDLPFVEIYAGTLKSRPSQALEFPLNKKVTSIQFLFQFIRVYGDFPSMSRLGFYNRDTVNEDSDKIFTDGTWSSLTSNFNSQQAINSFETSAKKHPFPEFFLKQVAVAREVLSKGASIRESVYTLQCTSNSGYEHNSKRIGQWFSRVTSTGYLIFKDEKIDTFCENFNNTHYPSVLFSKNFDRNNDDWQGIGLTQGYKEVGQSKQFIGTQFAAIYWNCGRVMGDGIFYAPKCRFSGGHKFPHYNLGDDVDKFNQTMVDYTKTATTDLSSTTKMPDMVELTGPNVILTTRASAAIKAITKDFQKYGKTIEDTIKSWEEMIVVFANYTGFDIKDPNPNHHPMSVTFINRLSLQEGKPYAWSDWQFTYYSSDFMGAMASWSSINYGGWGFYHEWGHSYDAGAIKIGETTNNLFSLKMQRYYGVQDRISNSRIWDDMARVTNKNKNAHTSVFETLGVLRQMEIFYGEDFVAKMYRMNRERFFDKIPDQPDFQQTKWIIGSSNITGYNCAPHYVAHGWNCTDVCQNYTKNLPPLPIRTWHITERVYNYKGKGLPQNVQPKVTTVINSQGSLSLQLTLEPISGNEFDDILGYEIRDSKGNSVGWTYKNTWTSATKNFNDYNDLSIYAIDLKMRESNPLKFKWGPIIEVQDFKGDYKPYPYPSNVTECVRESNHAISGILDDNNLTCYFTEKQSGKKFDTGFILDLQGPVTFGGFRHQNTRGDYGRTQHYSISISDDNITWNTILSGANLTLPDRDSKEPRNIFFDKEYTAQYFRFEQHDERQGTTHFSICDFKFLKYKIGERPIEGNKADSGNSNAAAIAVPIVVVLIIIAACGAVYYFMFVRNREDKMEDSKDVVLV